MIKNDKIQHFIVCFLITAFFAFLGSLTAGIIFALLWGFGKELWDWWKKGRWDWFDLVADVFGILAVVILGWLL